MSLHLHRARNIMGWALGIVAFLLCFDFSSPPKETLSDVTGRVTYSGRPLEHTTICLDSDGVHSAFSLLSPDGSFQLLSMTEYRVGASRGRYHAHLDSLPGGPPLPAKYRDPSTSGVEIEIDTDWSKLSIDLN
jgi:hypothetical protein